MEQRDFLKYRPRPRPPLLNKEEEDLSWFTNPAAGPLAPSSEADFNSIPKKRPQEFMKEGGEAKRPMTSQERAVTYQNILEKSLTPGERNKLNEGQESADVSSAVGKGIEMLLKGMFAGGAGGKDTQHWDRSRQIFRQRQKDREDRKDKRLTNLEKLQKSSKGREDQDATAPASRTLQAILARQNPDMAEEISKMSPEQIKDFGKYIFNKKTGGRGATESDADRELKKAKAGYYGRRGGASGSRESEADRLLKGAKTRYYDRKPGETDADWMLKNLTMVLKADDVKRSHDNVPGSPGYDAKQKAEASKAAQGPNIPAARLKAASNAAIGKLAEDQYDSAVLAGRDEELGGKGDYDPTSYFDYLDKLDITPNWMRSENGRAARNAMNSWVETYLRDASGAVIGVEERSKYYPIYFPMPGEGGIDIKNKKALREQKQKNMKLKAGQAGSQIQQNETGADGEIRATKERLDTYQQTPTDGKARLDKVLNKEPSGYPKYLYKDGKRVTVKDAGQESDATGKGWKGER